MKTTLNVTMSAIEYEAVVNCLKNNAIEIDSIIKNIFGKKIFKKSIRVFDKALLMLGKNIVRKERVMIANGVTLDVTLTINRDEVSVEYIYDVNKQTIIDTIDVYGTLVIDSMAAVKTLVQASLKANASLNKIYSK